MPGQFPGSPEAGYAIDFNKKFNQIFSSLLAFMTAQCVYIAGNWLQLYSFVSSAEVL